MVLKAITLSMLIWFSRVSLKFIRKSKMINIGIQILADVRRGIFDKVRV